MSGFGGGSDCGRSAFLRASGAIQRFAEVLGASRSRLRVTGRTPGGGAPPGANGDGHERSEWPEHEKTRSVFESRWAERDWPEGRSVSTVRCERPEFEHRQVRMATFCPGAGLEQCPAVRIFIKMALPCLLSRSTPLSWRSVVGHLDLASSYRDFEPGSCSRLCVWLPEGAIGRLCSYVGVIYMWAEGVGRVAPVLLPDRSLSPRAVRGSYT